MIATWQQGDWGGPMRMVFKDDARCDEYTKALNEECSRHAVADEFRKEYPTSNNSYWSEIVIATMGQSIELKKRLSRLAKTKIVYQLDGKYFTWNVPYTLERGEALLRKYPQAKIFNTELV